MIGYALAVATAALLTLTAQLLGPQRLRLACYVIATSGLIAIALFLILRTDSGAALLSAITGG